MATSRYVALTPIRHNGKLFAVGDALALTDAQAASLGSAIAPQAGALPAMPPDPPVPVLATPSGSGLRFVAPSGTVAADGTITLGTALPAVFASGVYLWLPAGAISGGTAGWYRAVMSSSTVGVIAGVGSGSAYTGSTSEVTAFTFDVPTPSKGSASILRLAHMCSSNTNAKTGRFRVGGTQYMTNAINTAGHALFVAKLLITGLGDGVVSITSENGGGSSAGGILTGVGSSISIDCTLQLATATDYIGCVPAIIQG